MTASISVPVGHRVDEAVLRGLGRFTGLYRSPRFGRPRWPYCSKPWCPGNRAYNGNGRRYVSAVEPVEEVVEVRVYGLTAKSRLLSALWRYVSTESLHGLPARLAPLRSVSLSLSLSGLEPLERMPPRRAGRATVEPLGDRVAVVGDDVAAVLVAAKLSEYGVKSIVFARSRSVLGGFYRFLQGLNRDVDMALRREVAIVEGEYIGYYDEGHALLSCSKLYLSRGPLVYAGGGEAPPPIAVSNDLPGIVSAEYGLELVYSLGFRPRRVAVLGYGCLASIVADRFASAGIETVLVSFRGGVVGRPERAELVEAEGVKGFYGADHVEGLVLSNGEKIAADMVVSILGFYPDANPAYAAGYKPLYVAECHRFIPEPPPPNPEALKSRGMLLVAGSVQGFEWLEAVVASANYAAALTARLLGRAGEGDVEHYYSELKRAMGLSAKCCPKVGRPPVWLSGRLEGLQFIDFDEDILLYHVYRAWMAGFRGMEMLKRATGLGTGPEQGRFSAVTAAAILASVAGVDAGRIGVFRARPPHNLPPVSVLASIPLEELARG